MTLKSASLHFSTVATMQRLWTKQSHQRPERGKINDSSVYFVPLCSRSFWQNDTKLANIQGEFNGPPEPLALVCTLKVAPSCNGGAPALRVTPPRGEFRLHYCLWGQMEVNPVWADMLLLDPLHAPPLPPTVVPNSKSSGGWASIRPILAGHTPLIYLSRWPSTINTVAVNRTVPLCFDVRSSLRSKENKSSEMRENSAKEEDFWHSSFLS